MNQVRNRDVDAHLQCACCKDITGASVNLLMFEHGKVRYIEHLDINVFDLRDTYIICESCAVIAFITLVNTWEEGHELSFDLDESVDLDDDYWFHDHFQTSDDIPLTWFCESEPDQCPHCLESHEDSSAVVQVSVVQREGRRFSEPIPQKSADPDLKNRYTWLCEKCVRDEFYSHIRPR